MGDRQDVITDATDPLVTEDYLREAFCDLHADIRRAFFIQTIVIVGSLTAIFAALIKL